MVAREGAQLSEQDVIGYTKERLAAYKYPREVRFLDALPEDADRQDPEGRATQKLTDSVVLPSGRSSRGCRGCFRPDAAT